MSRWMRSAASRAPARSRGAMCTFSTLPTPHMSQYAWAYSAPTGSSLSPRNSCTSRERAPSV
eukprot:scaffold9107_cov112-Isochrysis_galbana.AAC.8